MANEADAVEYGFEAMLASLRPTTATADPVVAAYAAGRAVGRRAVYRWRGVAAVAVFGAIVGHRGVSLPEPVAPRVTVAVAPPLPLFNSMARPAELVRVEQALLDRGLDGLPPAPRRAVFLPGAPKPMF